MSNQPKVAVALETVSLRLGARVGRPVERSARYLGSSTDRTHLAIQAIEVALRQDAELQKTLWRQAACAHGPSGPWRHCAGPRAEHPPSRRGETRPGRVVPSYACIHARLLHPPGGPPPLTHL
jgi:hypothetical protein